MTEHLTKTIRRVDPESHLSMAAMMDDRSLVGEDVVLQVGRSGFRLEYMPAGQAEWKSYPVSEMVGRSPSSAHTALFAAYEGDRLCGLALVQCRDDHWCDLLDLRVDASCRRQGFGTMLLEACTSYGQSHGMKGLTVRVSERNPVMCRFCQHTGLTVYGLDSMALAFTQSEVNRPMRQRACLITFYGIFPSN